jgi:hypothetical protein
LLISLLGCNKFKELKNDPDISPLQQGFKTSASIGYCTSLAVMAFQGQQLPANVIFNQGNNTEFSQSGILYVKVDIDNLLPFNHNIGDIIIAGIWDNEKESGVISIIFGDLDIFEGKYKFYGIHTVPFGRKRDSNRFITLFAQQDIVIGEGSDTLLNIGLSRVQFDSEMGRLEEEQPTDVFAAIQQNVWFIQFDQEDPTNLYVDYFEINGGGQIVSATNSEGRNTYHALLETKYDYENCNLNPEAGHAFIQNLKAGEGIDLGNIFLDFHSTCNGKGDVTFATGKYIGSNGRDINLRFN